ncbi:BnaC01g26630D [Brassica napus]|uniref:BnaC01g26630D protein n=1 Tax=Brassica napus TaxID=3708 RepID=A0A078FWR9_BRANA|nr:BnaC01g26630D [Brassica napus]
MHGLMSYRRFGRAWSLRSDRTLVRARSLPRSLCSDRALARARSLRSDRASTRARSLRSDRAEWAFGCHPPSTLGTWISSEVPMRGMASLDEIGVFGRSFS